MDNILKFKEIVTATGAGVYNIYVYQGQVFFINVDKANPEIRSLDKKYRVWTGIGMRFGLLGGLLITWPASAYYSPKIEAARERVQIELQSMSPESLPSLAGYRAPIGEVRLEAKRKKVRVHIGKDWLAFKSDLTEQLNTILHS
jgi:hypothetical protein